MPETFVRCLADTRGRGTCKACGAALTWMQTIAGKRMCFDGDPVALKTEHSEDRRLVEVFSSDDVHWSRCPQAGQFKRART